MVILGRFYANMGVEIPCSSWCNSRHICLVAVPSFQVSDFMLKTFTIDISCCIFTYKTKYKLLFYFFNNVYLELLSHYFILKLW